MSVSCQFNGRLGNIAFNICQVIAYAKKHGLDYWFPNFAWACPNGVPTIMVPSTGSQPVNPVVYQEPNADGHPFYHEIPKMDNVEFRGYYQSFRYFEEYRQDILDIFNLPHNTEYGIVSLHVRLGDCLSQPDAFPLAPREYYDNAIRYMIDKGYNKFRVFSDTIDMARNQFNEDLYPGAIFEYRGGYSELEDFTNMSCCEHNITARSTFSLMAGFFNQNPNKMVLCPSINKKWWNGQNRNLLDTEFLTQIDW